MNVIECYTREQLQQYVLGKLSQDLCEQISNHLNRCDLCEDTIVGLDKSGDTLVDLLANQGSGQSSSLQDSGSGKDQKADSLNEPAIEASPEFQSAVQAIRNHEFLAPAQPNDNPDPNPIGVRIGDYELEEKIASGGMGSVFRARHTRLEKSVAIKILPERKMQNTAAIARFTREMKIIGQMDHPTMVSATDAGESNGTHYLVMELVDGLDLARVVRLCGSLAIADACELTRRVAIGLEYGHEQGVIHRDVKPSNLMLTRDGNVKILDLGLATLGGLTGTVDELTTVGQLMGTLDYMAPEQCGNEFDIDRRTDVYGLGATLYKLLTGLAPYSNDAVDTPLKKLKAMAIESPTPIQDRRRHIPDQLAEVIASCIERHPNDRFETTRDLASALEPFCHNFDLVNLHERADLISRRTESVESEAAVQLSHAPPVAVKTYRPVKPLDLPKKTSPSVVRWVTAALFLGMASLLAWSGVTIYLDTIAGELVIDSEVDNITVAVIHDEKPSKEISIDHGPTSTKLRAGKYRIEILGESDGLVIKNDSFELKKGDKVVARIAKRTGPTESSIKGPDQVVVAPQVGSPRIGKLALATSEQIRLELVDLDHDVEVAKLRIELSSQKMANLRTELASQELGKQQRVQNQQALGAAQIEYQIAEREYERAIKKRETTHEIYNKRRESEKESAKVRISELQSSIAETQESLVGAERLYQSGFASGSSIDSLKRKLKSLHEKLSFEKARFKREYANNSERPPAESNQLPPVTNKTAAEKFREAFTPAPRPDSASSRSPAKDRSVWPTFRGTPLPSYVNSQINELILGREGFPQYEEVVPMLARKSTQAQITELIQKSIEQNKHEISFDAQLGIIRSLIPLCSSNEATEIVFDKMTEMVGQVEDSVGNDKPLKKLSRLLAILPKNQISECEELLIKLAESGNSREKYFSIGSMFKYMAIPPVPQSTGYIQIGSHANEGISASWLPVLIESTESENESLAVLASRALAWNWPNEPQVLEQFGKLLKSRHPLAKLAAIEVVTSQNPTHPDLINSISAAVNEKIASPIAFVSAIKNPAAVTAIERFMSDPMAGSREFTLPAGSRFEAGGFAGGMTISNSGEMVSGFSLQEFKTEQQAGGTGDSSAAETKRALDWSDRIDLILALGGHTPNRVQKNIGLGGHLGLAAEDMTENGKSRRPRLTRAEAKPFLPLLRKELERASFEEVLEAAWFSIGYITDQPIPNLYRGQTLAHWWKVLEQDDLSPSQHEHGLQAVGNLASQSFDIGSIVAIAKSFRGNSFDAPVGKNFSRSKTTKSKVYEALMRLFKSSSRQRLFIDSLDHLDDKDSMFALFILANLKPVSRGGGRSARESAISDKCRRYARRFIDSKDSKLRRRALFISTRFPDRNFPSGSDVEAQPIKEILTSASIPMELRLSFLDSLEMGLSPSEIPTSRLFAKTDDPMLVSTILTIAPDRGALIEQIDGFISEQLAENRDYLDESHRPMTLDLWNGPIESEASPEESGITIFEKIVNFLDSLGPKQLAVYQPRITRKVTSDSPSYRQKLKAIENLVMRYRKSEGATKRKLERILTTLAPESIDSK